MNASFKEKSTWLSLLAILYIFGNYILSVAHISFSEPVSEQTLSRLKESVTYAILLIIVVEIFFQSALAISYRKQKEIEGDERDMLIERKANTLGYYLLSIGIIVCISHMIYPEGLSFIFRNKGISESLLQSTMYMGHVLVVLFLVSEIIKMAYQIFLYRKDAL